MSADSPKNFVPVAKKKDYVRPTMPTSMLDGRGLKWIEDNRKLTKGTIEYFDVRMNERGTGLCWPYYKDGVLVNLKHRAFATKQFYNSKDSEPCLFNRDRCADNLERLIICEGEFDCMALHQYGIEAVSVPNGTGDCRWIDTEWDFLQRFEDIVLCLDDDAAGRALEEELIRRFGRHKTKVMRLPYKDANECLIKGVPPEKIHEELKYAACVPPELLVNVQDVMDDVINLFHDPGLITGTPTAFEPLTRMLGGWRYSELTVWSGTSGSGKSTMLNQVMLDLLRQRIPVCMASLEMPPKSYLRWAVMQWTGKRWPDDQEIFDAFQAFGPYFFIVNTHEEVEPARVLDCFTYAARRYGVKHFVIDSLVRLVFPMLDENKEHKKFVSEFLTFCKAYNVHGHLVAHPRKGYSDEDKPGKVDVGGTAHITNLAHNVLIMWRPTEEIKERARAKGRDCADARLIVAKHREEGEEGHIDLSFDPNSKKFTALP